MFKKMVLEVRGGQRVTVIKRSQEEQGAHKGDRSFAFPCSRQNSPGYFPVRLPVRHVTSRDSSPVRQGFSHFLAPNLIEVAKLVGWLCSQGEENILRSIIASEPSFLCKAVNGWVGGWVGVEGLVLC